MYLGENFGLIHWFYLLERFIHYEMAASYKGLETDVEASIEFYFWPNTYYYAFENSIIANISSSEQI